jgi:endonuclease YncB( thermonuclease family)
MLYNYIAVVKNVFDGDAITVDLDLGFGVTLIDRRLRLRGVDAPKLKTEDPDEKKRAYETREFVKRKVAEVGNAVYIRTYKSGKFGKFISDVWFNKKDAEDGKWETTLNFMLLDNHLAVEFVHKS